jgi:hypothetical protein
MPADNPGPGYAAVPKSILLKKRARRLLERPNPRRLRLPCDDAGVTDLTVTEPIGKPSALSSMSAMLPLL